MTVTEYQQLDMFYKYFWCVDHDTVQTDYGVRWCLVAGVINVKSSDYRQYEIFTL